MKENQDTWLAGSDPLLDRCNLYPRIRRMLLGVTSPVLAPRMLKWSGGMEPRFISWNAAALYTFDFIFPDIWIRKKTEVIPSGKPEVSAGHWNDVYAPPVDKSRLNWPRRETVVMIEVSRESSGGIYIQ